jgi:AAA+ ATPase superfamily predicted ATPase
MLQQFVDRNQELDFLEKKYLENSAQLIIIYGRRRVGKTELIKKFLQGKKGIYFLCSRDSITENIKELKRKFSEFTKKEYFLKLDIDSFFDLFKYFVDEIKEERVTIVFDEFPYLIELSKGVVSTFQKTWDELLKDKKVFLILCGSSIGMMETEVLGYKSPLYGRRTGEWKVEPFKLKDMLSVFRNFSLDQIFQFWSIFGATPFYLNQINPNFSLEENIKIKILSKGEVLYNEPIILLREEFREPRTYTLILKYLSLGYNTLGELSSITGIDKGNLSKYISELEETRLIEYILPLGQRKRGIYAISEPFFNFWFRFVYPNLSDLEAGLINEVYLRISSQLNSYFGLMFEKLIFELVKTKEVPLPISFTEIRKWWYKDKEIDIIALNQESKQIIFAECKWQDDVNVEKIVKELKEKSKFVKWGNAERREYFILFAKSFKEKIEEPNIILFDLKSLENALKQSGRVQLPTIV